MTTKKTQDVSGPQNKQNKEKQNQPTSLVPSRQFSRDSFILVGAVGNSESALCIFLFFIVIVFFVFSSLSLSFFVKKMRGGCWWMRRNFLKCSFYYRFHHSLFFHSFFGIVLNIRYRQYSKISVYVRNIQNNITTHIQYQQHVWTTITHVTVIIIIKKMIIISNR